MPYCPPGRMLGSSRIHLCPLRSRPLGYSEHYPAKQSESQLPRSSAKQPQQEECQEAGIWKDLPQKIRAVVFRWGAPEQTGSRLSTPSPWLQCLLELFNMQELERALLSASASGILRIVRLTGNRSCACRCLEPGSYSSRRESNGGLYRRAWTDSNKQGRGSFQLGSSFK